LQSSRIIRVARCEGRVKVCKRRLFHERLSLAAMRLRQSVKEQRIMEAATAVTTTRAKSDEQIQRDVLAELKWDAQVAPNEIGVLVKDGVVTLTGWVDAYTKKWAAEEAAHRVRGVRAVANDIEVKLPISSQRTDADIAAAALRALEWDAEVPADNIEVTVSHGWVTLTGEVDWQFQRLDAERVIRRLAGVVGVTNLIGIRPQPKPSEVKQKIEQALIRSVKTDADRINVDVVGDMVILNGTVRSLADRQEAERAAWQAPGVKSVENQITISYYD
jgi:osmotically-inducible protein OsmY